MGLFSGLKERFAESQLFEVKSAEAARELLEKGVNPNCQDKKGWTPLLRVLNVNPLTKPRPKPASIAEALIERGADVYHEAAEHICACVITAFRNEPKAMKALLHGTADSAKKINHRAAALSLASGMGHAKIVKLLLEAGTPAELEEQQTEVMELLLHGIPAEIVTSVIEGTRLMKGMNDPRTVIKYCRWQWPSLHRAVFAADAEVVSVLLGAGANPNRAASDELTPLQVLETYTPDEKVRELLTNAGATG